MNNEMLLAHSTSRPGSSMLTVKLIGKESLIGYYTKIMV